MTVSGGWCALAGAAAALACGAAALAQETPSFPSSMDREALLLWLQRETDILPDRVVAVTPQALTAVVSSFPAGGAEGPRVVIRAEALSAETYARTEALSWHVSVVADCRTRRVKLGETTGYPRRNLLGERKVLRAAEGDWRAPERGTALDNAWRAACESDFRGPFASSTLKVAQETAPPPASARAPETAQQPVPSRPPAAPPPVATASAHGTAARPAAGLVAQVGATTSEPEARRLLASLGDQVDGRDTWVETAVVAGRTWRRAVVGGFADAGEANRFCAAMKAAKRDCFVRPAAAK